MTDLGMPAGGLNAAAYDVNDFGSIVGSAETAGNTALSWVHQDGVMTNLSASVHLVARGSRGFTQLWRPNAINNRGQMVGVGEWCDGAGNYFPRAFLLTPRMGQGTSPHHIWSVGQVIDETVWPGLVGSGRVVSLTGLPPGIRYNATTARLVGRPTTAGAYPGRIGIRDLNGRVAYSTIRILVERLPIWAQGSFSAYLLPPTMSHSGLLGLGGSLTLKTSPTGTYTGSLQLGSKRYAFRGQINGIMGAEANGTPLNSTATIITQSRDRSKDLSVNLEFRPGSAGGLQGLSGSVVYEGVSLPISYGWRQVWNAKSNAPFAGFKRLINVQLDNTESTGPQGDGFAVINADLSGLVRWSASLADGRKVTGSSVLSPSSDLALHNPLTYSGSGVFSVLLPTEWVGDAVRIANPQPRNGRWVKLATTNPRAVDRSYRAGFDIDLNGLGAEFRPQARGVLLFGRNAAPSSLSFNFTDGGIASSAELPGSSPVTLNGELRANNVMSLATASLPSRTRASCVFDYRTGLVRGTISLLDDSPLDATIKMPRTLSYQGLYVPNLTAPTNSRIRGFFTLPELPATAGQKTTTTPILSGLVEIR